MASVHKQPGKPHYFCSYSTRRPDGTWQRHFKSTKTASRKQAEEICRSWELAARQASNGRLTPEAARDVIARGVADIYATANAEDLPGASVRTWCDQWLEAKKIESARDTVERYRNVLDNFFQHIGPKADKDLTLLRPLDVQRFRDNEAKMKSRNTANVSIKVLRAAFGAAVKAEIIGTNPAKAVDKLKQQGESQRRPFTDAELKRVLDASKGTELHGLTLFGAFTGQRLSDVKNLTWRQVDMAAGTVAFITSKTGRRLLLPLLAPLQEYVATLPSSDNPDAPIFPVLAASDASTASNGFFDLLVDVGLATARTKKNTGKGRHAARQVAPLTYHSLRHYFVSKLKSGGLSDTVSMAIVGHSSQTIHHQYAHLDVHDLRRAMESALPDVTAKTKATK